MKKEFHVLDERRRNWLVELVTQNMNSLNFINNKQWQLV